MVALATDLLPKSQLPGISFSSATRMNADGSFLPLSGRSASIRARPTNFRRHYNER